MLYNNLDIYQAKIEDELDGMYCISLVDYPAVEREFVCFKENSKQQVKFAIDNEEKRNISGVVMLADVPIYRRNGDYEYYITYSRETIEKMANKLLKDGLQNQISIMHDGNLITGISMTELYIKDSSKGIEPNFINDVTDGSLMATFHVEDENLWKEIKEGDVLNGFSLEGLFSVEKMNNNKINKKTNMSKIAKFIKSLMKYGEVTSDKGVLYWDGEEEIKVNDEIYVDGENDEKLLAEDGEYKIEDKIIVVKDGKVIEIREIEIEEPSVEEKPAEEEEIVEEKVEEQAEEEKVEEVVEVEEPIVEEEPKKDERDERIELLEGKLDEINAEIENLKAQIEKIVKEPAATPIVEEFNVVNTPKESRSSKSARLLSNLNK